MKKSPAIHKLVFFNKISRGMKVYSVNESSVAIGNGTAQYWELTGSDNKRKSIMMNGKATSLTKVVEAYPNLFTKTNAVFAPYAFRTIGGETLGEMADKIQRKSVKKEIKARRKSVVVKKPVVAKKSTKKVEQKIVTQYDALWLAINALGEAVNALKVTV